MFDCPHSTASTSASISGEQIYFNSLWFGGEEERDAAEVVNDLIEQLKKNASIDISAKSSISDTDITLPSETCEQIFESSNHFNDQFPFSATSQDYGHAHQWVESPCQPFFQDYSASIAPTVPSIFSPHSIVNDYAYTTSTIDDSSAPAFPWTFDSNSAVNFNKSLVICSRFDNFNPPCSQQHLPQDGPYANATDLNVLLATPKPCPMRQSASSTVFLSTQAGRQILPMPRSAPRTRMHLWAPDAVTCTQSKTRLIDTLPSPTGSNNTLAPPTHVQPPLPPASVFPSTIPPLLPDPLLPVTAYPTPVPTPVTGLLPMVTSGAVHSPAAMVNRFIQRNAVPSQAAAAYAAFLMGGHGSNFVPTGVSQQGPSNGAPSTAPKQNVYSAVPYVSAEMQSIGPDSLAVPHTATATATATVNNQASYQSHLPGQRSYYGPQPTASAPATVSSSGIGQKRRYNTEEDANGRPEYTCQWGGQCGAKIAPRSSAVRAHIKEDHAGDTWCRETIVRGIAQLCSFTLCRWPGCSKAGVEMKVQCIGRHIETHLQSCGVVCPACNRVLCRSDALLRHLRMKPACRDLLAQARAHPAVHPGEDESGEDRMEKRPRY